MVEGDRDLKALVHAIASLQSALATQAELNVSQAHINATLFAAIDELKKRLDERNIKP